MFKTENTPRKRATRLVSKLIGTPFLPVLAWSKVVEASFTAVPMVPSLLAAGVLTVLWVFGEDLQEYLEQQADQVEQED